MLRFVDSELGQDRWGDIRERGSFDCDPLVAQQYAGNQRVIDAVVAAPGLDVVLQDHGRKAPQDSLPARPITAIVSDHKVGRTPDMRACVYFVRSVDASD